MKCDCMNVRQGGVIELIKGRVIKRVTILNQELDSLEMLSHQAGMNMGELQRMQVEAGENIQGADDVLTKALKFISNAEDSLNLASAYISKFNQYYKSADAQKGRAAVIEGMDMKCDCMTKEFAELVARVSELEKGVDARFDMLTNVAKGQSEVCKHLANKINDLYDYMLTNVAEGQSEVCKHLGNKISDLYDYVDAFEGDDGHE